MSLPCGPADDNLTRLQQDVGYCFGNRALLGQALVHASYRGSADSNERLEFLGDRVLGLAIAHLLHERYPAEAVGSVARRHAALVRREALSEVARRIGLPKLLRMSRGEDNVYFVGQQSAIKEFEETFVNTYEKIERVMIIGAGRTGRFLAPMLEEQGLFVKVIEKNKDRCQLIAQKLENGIVLCGDGTDIDLLTEEGIAEADVVICITEDDKLNLLLALMAKHLGAKKTIVRVARNEYVELMEKVGVDIVLSSRLLSSGEVLRFVRKGGIVSVSLLEGAKAEALEIILPDDCEVIGKSLKDIKLPRACLVCAVVHDNEAVVPNGNTVLYAGDRIIIFVKSEFVKRVMPFFESRG